MYCVLSGELITSVRVREMSPKGGDELYAYNE